MRGSVPEPHEDADAGDALNGHVREPEKACEDDCHHHEFLQGCQEKRLSDFVVGAG